MHIVVLYRHTYHKEYDNIYDLGPGIGPERQMVRRAGAATTRGLVPGPKECAVVYIICLKQN